VPIKLKRSILAVTYLFITSCNVAVQTDNTSTAESIIITSTLPSTAILPLSETPLPPPTFKPTITPIEGTTSTQLNVRAEPSTASEVVGIIAANSIVQIIGKDIGESWWQIIYEAGVDGKGWVTAQYVETGGRPQVPVIGSDGSNPQSGNTAIIIQQLNIRSGPGTNFDSIGILNVNDVVNLTGRNRSGTWLQIVFSAGPDSKGWVNSGFVKTDSTTGLPIVSDAGDVLGTGTPVNPPLPPTPTLVPAAMDFDTPENPLKTVILGGVDAHAVLYNGDVSFPEGDTEDWFSITPQENVLFAKIECFGSELIRVEVIGKETNLSCNGNTQAISVSVNVPIIIHIQATGPANQLHYTKYILNIKVSP